MNNYRLSTYQGTVYYLSKDEKVMLINAQPTIEHLKDGRLIDLITKKVLRRRSSSCIYEIIKPSGQIILKANLVESAQILGTNFNTLKHLAVFDNNSEGVVIKGHKVRKIQVFYPIN